MNIGWRKLFMTANLICSIGLFTPIFGALLAGICAYILFYARNPLHVLIGAIILLVTSGIPSLAMAIVFHIVCNILIAPKVVRRYSNGSVPDADYTVLKD